VEAAVRNSFKPITVTIVDPASNISSMQVSTIVSIGAFPEYSLAKARAAQYLLMPSRDFRDRYMPVGTSKPQDFSKLSQLFAMVEISGSQIAPFPPVSAYSGISAAAEAKQRALRFKREGNNTEALKWLRYAKQIESGGAE
ncbi:hypothetical protein B484DRAFT_432562, partial [Ochromonadaceae sp. CCMP2298]